MIHNTIKVLNLFVEIELGYGDVEIGAGRSTYDDGMQVPSISFTPAPNFEQHHIGHDFNPSKELKPTQFTYGGVCIRIRNLESLAVLEKCVAYVRTQLETTEKENNEG